MMGDGDGCECNEEVEIEFQLENQLNEQKESLLAVNDALASDPQNPDLLSVHGQLLESIKDAEEGLLHLKRSRLLKKADEYLSKQETNVIFDDVKLEQLDPTQVESKQLNSEAFGVGSKCRFRHTDGRWYNGHIIGLEGSNLARISFLSPTSESMLTCKFFIQQRCRFGNNCRLSHGFSIPISSLKQYIPAEWNQSLAGSRILATSAVHSGIWRKAELESWDESLRLGRVIFQDDGTSAILPTDALSKSEFAEMSDDAESNEASPDTSSSSQQSGFSDTVEDDFENQTSVRKGIGSVEATASQDGVQTETVLFAKWEHHTRGIASKMMASMGYREGMGLGASGQGIVDPVSVKVVPKNQSLDRVLASSRDEGSRESPLKKRSRGGKREREKKHARAAKLEEEQNPDMFTFINNQLAGQEVTSDSRFESKKVARAEDRRSLVAYDDEVKVLRTRIEKWEEMVERNRKDKTVFEAASRKLSEAHKALAEAEAAHASASSALASREKEKKWLKF